MQLRFPLLVEILLISTFSFGQVSGTIFNDYNGNGTKNNSATFNEPGASGVIVQAYNAVGAALTVTYVGGGSSTNSTGQYSVSGGTLGQIRLEFVLPDNYLFASNGATGGTTVMFPSAATQNLAINEPSRYCQADPKILTNCYVSGAQAGSEDVLLSFPYSDSGESLTVTHDALANEIGTTWGIAYNRITNKSYAAAFIKRHSGLGSGGIGAIYEIDPTETVAPALWLDIETLPGVDAGSIGTNAARGLGLPTNSSTDATAFDKVGKEGIGDIDISDDGKQMYVMNLFQKEVLVIDIATKTLVQTLAIPDPGCNANGSWRPFATKFYRGEVYIGVVCSGETSGVIGNFFVMKWNGSSWTTLISNILNYPKGWVHATYATPPTVCSVFESWTSDFTGIHSAGSSTQGPRWCRPQPILSDIEFDIDGSMLIGFIDRAGHQLGYQNSNTAGTQLGNGYVGGDILRAAPNGAGFTLENAGTTTLGGGCGANAQGPGGGEFYCGERYSNIHQEISLGGLALFAGKNEALTSAMDPGNVVFAGGIIALNNSTGQKDDYYQLFASSGPTTFGKAAGIGDVEILCNPAPIEIGNRVWLDNDKDGIQDAGEPGMPNVTVELRSADGSSLIATTTTNASGNYFFSSAITPAIQPETSYLIRIPNVDGGSKQANLGSNTLTTANNDGSMNGDSRDSDGLPVGVNAEVTVLTSNIPYAGANNHNFDFGFAPSIFDLALTKKTNTILPVKANDNVPFTITVYNQGTTIVNSVTITDYVPAGFIYNGGSNPNWSGSAPMISYTASVGNSLLTAPGIAPGDSLVVPLALTVSPSANGTNIANFAEISAGSDVDGNTAADDIDSTPDTNPNNDAGGAIGSGADNYINGDGTGTPGNGVAATDEDDHDGATVRLVDMALKKTISVLSPPPYMHGNAVTFDITIYNQGLESLQNIEISDYLPSGFAFTPNNGWSQLSPTLLSKTVAGPIVPGDSLVVNLQLTIQPSYDSDAWTNYSEISDYEDMTNTSVAIYDFDSNIDNDPNNDSGGQEGSNADNYINGNGTGAVGDGVAATDEDDHDPAKVDVYDLALRKTLMTSGPYSYGQLLTFRIAVFNQGNVVASNIVINDYVPNGYIYSSNNGWTGSLPTLVNTITGPLMPGDSAIVFLNLILQNSPNGQYINHAEIASGDSPDGPAFDGDSSPNSNTQEENNIGINDPQDDDITAPAGGDDQDDHDPAGPQIFDLALKKEVVTAVPSYSYGQNVMYRIILFNQGSVAATNIGVHDVYPCGFEFDAGSPVNVGWINTPGNIQYLYTDTLQPGLSDTLYVDMIVRPCYNDANNNWTNYAEITDGIDVTTGAQGQDIDSSPDNDITNDTGGIPDFNGINSGTDNTVANENGDEDDHDPHKIQVFDLALSKSLLTSGPHQYGDVLTFGIEVTNQGNVVAQNIVISDYIPAGYSFTPNNGWTGTQTLITNTIAGPINPGGDTQITLQLTLQPQNGGSNGWNNYAEVSSAQDNQNNNRNDDADSVADNVPNNDNQVLPNTSDDNNIFGLGPNANEDEDDHDVAAPVIVDLALTKQVLSAGPFTYGNPVTFRVRVTNQGNTPVENTVVSDYLPAGFTFAANNGWSQISSTLLENTITTRINPGASVDVNLILTPIASSAQNAWLNIAEISSFQDTLNNPIGDLDIDSTPDTDPDNDAGGNPNSPSDDSIAGDGSGNPGDSSSSTDEDDHDPALLPIHDVALTKTGPLGAFNVGDVVTFTITVTNQGNSSLDSLAIIDYIPSGYSFVNNNNWVTAGSNASLTATVGNGLIPIGGVLPQSSVAFPIQLTVAPFANAANVINVAEITGSRDLRGLTQIADADSFADNNPNNDAGGNVGSASDNVIDGNGTGLPNDTNAATDEDDQDPATISLQYYSLGNQVWNDGNNNAIKDMTELPIQGVAVELYYINPITSTLQFIASTTTDANGLYLFDSLSNGDYRVVLPASNFTTGQPFSNFTSSTGSGALSLTTGTYEDANNPIDTNNDIDNDDNGVMNGLLAFPNAIVSNVVTLAGGEPTGENPDNDPNTPDAFENLTVDFGLVPLHSIGNRVWVDINNNRNFDVAEAPLSGVEVNLHYIDPISGNVFLIGTAFTDANGLYLFDSLIAGQYIVEIPSANFASGNVLDGFLSSTGNGAFIGSDAYIDADNNIDNDDNGRLNGNPLFVGSVVSDTITLNGSEPLLEALYNDFSGALDNNSNLTIDFGFFPYMTIGNFVWNDVNNDGQYNVGESSIAGVSVNLHYVNPISGNTILLQSVITDGNGFYLFDSLIQGNYIVEIPSSNFGSVLSGMVSSTGNSASTNFGPNEDINNQISPNNGVDSDDNGVLNGNPNFVGSVVSDTIALIYNLQPTGESQNNDTSGALDENSNLTVDFGFVTLHSIGNQVWLDDNYNGIIDGVESGISGVTVTLYQYDPTFMTSQLVQSTTTDANGLYLFDSLYVGQYFVVIPNSQLQPGGPLQNYLSSTGTFNNGGIYETPGLSANTDIDNDDNGRLNTNPMFFLGVVSDTVTLVSGTEPLGENPNNDVSGALDQNSNLTVDFGFIPKVFDLALTKQLASASPVSNYGDVVQFDVTIYNQGNVIANNILITDYIPSGFVLDASSLGWTLNGTNAEYTYVPNIAPNSSITIPVYLQAVMTDVVGGYVNYAEISVAMDEFGNSTDINVVSPYGPLVDIDSSPDNTNGNDAGGELDGPSDNAIGGDGSGPVGSGLASEDEDDHDVASVEIIDIALRKTVETAGPFVYGQAVTYRITVFNQGNVPLYNININDYLPEGLSFDPADNSNWTLTGNIVNYAISGPLAEQQSTDVFITLRPHSIPSNSTVTASSWVNRAEIESFTDNNSNDITSLDIDSDGDNDSTNDAGGQPNTSTDDEINGDPNDNNTPLDEDDADPANIEIFDLALRKTITSAGPYSYGDIITFQLEVFNQGNVDATNIVISDYLPAGYAFTPNNGWTGSAPTIQNTIVQTIAPGASTTIFLDLVVQQTQGGSKDWINYAEIVYGESPSGAGFDADSSPGSNGSNENNVLPNGIGDDDINSTSDLGVGSQDDHDPAGITVFDLALRKEVVTATPSYSYGQNVMYRITVYNQGSNPASNIELTDYLPCGLTLDASSAMNAGWTVNGSNAVKTLSNTILPGQSFEVFLDLIVVPCYVNESNAWTNFVEISDAIDNTTGLSGQDIDSNPDNDNANDAGGDPSFEAYISNTDNTINNEFGDEDDHDPHKIQVFDLALRKSITNEGPYMIGQNATFNIEVFNQGNVVATNIVINDYLRSGFTFNAGLNPGWTLTTPATPFANGLINYTINSDLNPGQSIQVDLVLTVALDINPAASDWFNYAEIGSATDTLLNNRNDDADSNPNTNNAYENQVLPGGPYDNVIDGIGQLFNQDEDDHDPARIIVVGGLGDTVWKDLDGDGIRDAGEPGVGGVIATLTDCNGNVLQTTTTNAQGFYFFNSLVPGNYQVQFDISNLPPGCGFTLQNSGANDAVDSDVDITGLGPCVSITGGQYDSTYDAGLLLLSALGDFVWHDLNGDGRQTAGEPGIPGIQVNLYAGNGTFIRTQFTEGTGRYLFDGLYPGDYYVSFVTPDGFTLTSANTGNNDSMDSDVDNSNGPGTTATTTLAPGERDLTWDAGFYKCIPIGENVWYDYNRNDLFDPFENGINGLVINLWRNTAGSWAIYSTTHTGNKPGTPSDDGYFKFCAPPGQYYIQVIMPPLGLVRARPNIGNNELLDSDLTNAFGQGTTQSFTVSSGQEKCDIGAGFYPMAVAGNLVWMDENNNGVQDNTERKVAGVVVEAIDPVTNDVVAESVTDDDGVYMLDYLEKGNIYLKFYPPSGYSATGAHMTSDEKDNDVDHANGYNTTRVFSMQPGMVNENIDLGIAYGVLPVEWLGVQVTDKRDFHLVEWQVSSEINTSHYQVERSIGNTKDFAPIGDKILSHNLVNTVQKYAFSDVDISVNGIYYYRVRQVDADGKVNFSKIVSVKRVGEQGISLYPNPAKEASRLDISIVQNAEINIEIFDREGKLVNVLLPNQIVEKGVTSISIDTNALLPGVYNVIITIDGVSQTKKLIVIR